MCIETCNEYLKKLEGKIVILKMQQVYSINKEPYQDLINSIEEITIKNISLNSDSYLCINNTFINLTPECYHTREFNSDEMRFDCENENLSLTISFNAQ
jgi:hypothetical protein